MSVAQASTNEAPTSHSSCLDSKSDRNPVSDLALTPRNTANPSGCPFVSSTSGPVFADRTLCSYSIPTKDSYAYQSHLNAALALSAKVKLNKQRVIGGLIVGEA